MYIWETIPFTFRCPLQMLLFSSFKHHVFTHHPKEILALDEFLKLRQELVAKSSGPGEDEEGGGDDNMAPPGEDVPPGMETEGGKVRGGVGQW